MNKLEKAKNLIKKHKSFLTKNFKIKEIGIFGSFVKGEQGKNSDIDILVEFYEPIGLFAFFDLEEYLKNILGRKVDLVSKKALKPFIGKYILSELVLI